MNYERREFGSWILGGCLIGLSMLWATDMAAQTGDGNGGGTGGSVAITAATAQRTASGIRVDGIDSEADWATVQRFSDFRQFTPEPDADPSQRTEFRVLYDDANLYVFVRAFDSHPDSIMRALTRRDVRGPSDQISIFIDSYNDRRTGFNFHVNPDGVKRDHALFDDGAQDQSWNGVWDVATQVDSLGWTAEFRIPLSQLRYGNDGDQTFGFGVWRDIERHNERVSWPLFNRERNGLVSQLGQLEGLKDLGSARRVEIAPYVVGRSVSRPTGTAAFERVQQTSVGGDLKIGITSNITLDATVNPDFGQVEADPAVLNLTAFETFQREQRPFFLEGTGLYKFALNCYIVVDCQTNEGLFYSRRIGRRPSLADRNGDATTPISTPIAAAGKLTGRSNGGLSFGLLNAYTRPVDGINGETAEPGTNYAVLRAQQDLRGGDAGVSVIMTAVNRGLDASTQPFLHESAYVAGASFRNRFSNDRFELAGSFAASRVTGDPAAITRTQRSVVHYYQQPGDDNVVDSSRTSLTGSAAQLKFGKYGGGITRFETSVVRQSAGFDVNDLGFLRRADIVDWSTWAALTFQTPTAVFRWAQVNGNHWQRWNTSGLRLTSAVNFNGHIGLHNNWNLHAGSTFTIDRGSYCDRCTRGGPPLRESRGIYPWFGFNGDGRRLIAPGMWVNLGFEDEGQTNWVSLNPYVVLRLSTGLQAQIGANYYRADNNTQWYGNFTDNTGLTHYTFASLDQRTVSMNLRVNYTATPDLTLELYAEPFSSHGTYSDIREVSGTPDAAAYVDRFVSYTAPAGSPDAFSFLQLRTNSVLRWEYRPGSTLFLAWAHGRESSTVNQGRQPWRDDFMDLFDLRANNTFLIKVAYWLNR